MSVILYARVSTGEQAERDLSIPAQFRALRHLATDRGWAIAAEFQDVGTGRSMQERPGLMATLRMASENKLVDAVLVHRVDRLARNVYSYLTLKAKLRQAGVRIVSYVEHFDANPMGEFLEHVMAAQAEFYSANLSMEVKKGLEERLKRGRWTGAPPLGYLRQPNGWFVLDPVRSSMIREGFERWAAGKESSTEIAAALAVRGLLGRHGKPIRGVDVCRILQNPFYAGQMKVNGANYPGAHPPTVTTELFDRCQEIFRQRRTPGRPRANLAFLLSGKLLCPRCGKALGGEEHRKPSGLVFRYYRCKRSGCGFTVRAEGIDEKVIERLLALNIPSTVPLLQRRIRETMRREEKERAGRICHLKAEREKTRMQHALEAEEYFAGRLDEDTYTMKHEEALHAMRAADRLIADEERGFVCDRGDHMLLGVAKTFQRDLESDDPVRRRCAADAVIEDCRIFGDEISFELVDVWKNLIDQMQERVRKPIGAA